MDDDDPEESLEADEGKLLDEDETVSAELSDDADESDERLDFVALNELD